MRLCYKLCCHMRICVLYWKGLVSMGLVYRVPLAVYLTSRNYISCSFHGFCVSKFVKLQKKHLVYIFCFGWLLSHRYATNMTHTGFHNVLLFQLKYKFLPDSGVWRIIRRHRTFFSPSASLPPTNICTRTKFSTPEQLQWTLILWDPRWCELMLCR